MTLQYNASSCLQPPPSIGPNYININEREATCRYYHPKLEAIKSEIISYLLSFNRTFKETKPLVLYRHTDQQPQGEIYFILPMTIGTFENLIVMKFN